METEGVGILIKELKEKIHNFDEKEGVTLDDFMKRGRPNWDAADEAFYDYKRFNEL